MLEALKKKVYEANMQLVHHGLVIFTWGNVSAIDRERGYVVIKPSGVEYNTMSPMDMVVVDLEGNIIEGHLKPSSDTPTHIELYKSFPDIGGVTHTHSLYATSFAQAGRGIKPFGTTHADYFGGTVPCTRKMSPNEISGDYEKNTGIVIAETFKNLDPNNIHGVLVHSHGPFTWGHDAMNSVENAVVLENIAHMAFNTELLQISVGQNGGIPMQQDLLNKHFYRKHGAGAYYGQN
ncbi:MAG: L-ribulose-5-phosphate 4-epimerase [Clostridia bacterium]|nr:L-ribulose-5-phosphate 4-epimerase [Clostridia bacterium]